MGFRGDVDKHPPSDGARIAIRMTQHPLPVSHGGVTHTHVLQARALSQNGYGAADAAAAHLPTSALEILKQKTHSPPVRESLSI